MGRFSEGESLAEEAEKVVKYCVNLVGVNLNTTSVSLLQYISGLTQKQAENIVAFRTKHKEFTNIQQLLSVKRIGPKTFEQAAGFLRIYNRENPLDTTGIHP